ncbi:MAG TPA: hydrogenase nickel incorporation protein HypB [bacterium]|nr:hydrogenase nickel incorporation protein HypB [bacterium]
MEIKIVRDIMEENDEMADEIRRYLDGRRTSMINVMSAPGSGKTLLFERIIPMLREAGIRVGIIEGDIATENDAQRIGPLGSPVALITTETFGGSCHLSAPMIKAALKELSSHELDLVLVENVGNLVCPAEFDIGARASLVLVSVVEGEDKPLKYPSMFRLADMVCVTKCDIAEAVGADVEKLKANVKQVNPEALLVESSGKTGRGMEEVARWAASLGAKAP